MDLERDFPLTLLDAFWSALNGFMGRTLSSNSVTDLVKFRRGIICRDIIHTIPSSYRNGLDNLDFNQVPVSIGKLQAMKRWCANQKGLAGCAQVMVAIYLASMQERNDDWITLASDVCGLVAHVLQDNIAHAGDNVVLATLINTCRQAIHSNALPPMLKRTDFHIHHTLPGLQQDFCTLWNESVQEARIQGSMSIPARILRRLRHHYVALHEGTDAAPTTFSASTDSFDFLEMRPSLYPFCDIASHRPNSITHVPVPNPRAASLFTQPGPGDSPDASPHHSACGGITASRQVNEAGIIAGSPSLSRSTTPGEIGGGSQAPAVTSLALPVHISSRPSDASPSSALSAALQVISWAPAATLLHPLEGITQRHMVPVPASTPFVLNNSLVTWDAGAASASNHLFPASSIVEFSIPAAPPPSHVPPSHIAEFLTLFSSTTTSRPIGNAALLPLRARGLINTGNICFANAVLLLLVHSPPFWKLFMGLGDLKGQRGAGTPEINGVVTPLVGATVRFFEEFVLEEPPPTQQPTQQAAGGKPSEDEAKKEQKAADSFEPIYMYDTMKEKRKLKNLLVRSLPFQLAPCFY